MAKVIIVC